MAAKDKFETALRQAYQGLTFSFGDEGIDLLASAIAAASPNVTFKEALKEARDISRQNIAKDWKENLPLSLAANIAGGVPFGLAMAGKNVAVRGLSGLDKVSKATSLDKFAQALTAAGGNVSNWATTGNRLARAAKGAAVGGGLGAVSGVGAGDDSVQGRTVGGLTGLGIGSIVGGVGGALSREQPTVKNVAQKAAKAVSENRAEDEFIRQLMMRPDLDEMQKRAIAYQALSKKTGVELTLPEMLAQTDVDPLLAQQSVLTKTPETAGQAQAILQRRMGDPLSGQPGQLVSSMNDVSQSLAPGNYDDLAQGLLEKGREGAKRITEQLSGEAGPMYSEAFSANKSISSKELDKILETPAGKKAMARTLEIFQNEGTRLGVPDKELTEMAREVGIKSKGGVASGLKLQTYDMIKRGLDDMISDEISRSTPGTTSATAKGLMSLRSRLLDELDRLDVTAKAGPNSLKPEGGLYAQARSVYSSQPEALANRKLMGGLANIDELKPQTVVGQLYRGTPGTAQRTAEALGPEGSQMAAAAKIQDIIGGLKSGQLPPKLDADTIQMLQTYAGPQADAVTDYLKVLERARAGERFLRGSQTSTNQAIQQGMGDAAASAAVDAATGNHVGLLRKSAGAIMEAIKGSNAEQYNRDLLNLFTTPRGMEALDQAVKAQQKLMATPGVSNLPVTSIGSTALGRPAIQPGDVSIPSAYSSIPAVTQSTMQALPPGYTVRKQDNQLPEGYTIRR